MIKKLLLFSLLLVYFSSAAQWIPTSGTYHGNATSFASKGDTILITDPENNGHICGIYRSVDGGLLWKLIYRTPEFLKSIVISGNNFLAASNIGTFFSNDYGEHWVKRDNGLTSNANNILFTEKQKVYLSKADGLFVTSDDGLNWSKVNSSAPVESIICTLKSGSKLFAGTSNKGLLVSGDDGTTWSTATTDLANMKIASLATDGINLFAATDGSGVFISTNNGLTWNAANSGLAQLRVSSVAIVDSTLFAGTIDGLFYSVDKGVTWAKQAEISGIVKTCYVYNKTIFAAVSSDAIYSSSNQGKSWDQLTNGMDNPSSFILVADGNDLYVVSGMEWERIYKTSNQGESWKRIDSGFVNFPISNLLLHNNKFYAGGANGLSVSNDHGRTWNRIDYPNCDISAIAGWKDTLYASSFACSSLYASYDNGVTWKSIYSGNLLTALQVKDGNIYVGTDGYGLFRSTDKGINFTRIDGGLMDHQVTAIHIDNKAFLVGTSSGLFQSVDNGATWTKKTKDIWENSSITSFLTHENKLFLTSSYGVYISNDNGNSWKSIHADLVSIRNFSLAKIGSTIFVSDLKYGVFKRDISDFTSTVPVYANDQMSFTIFPNPSTGKIQLQMPVGAKQVIIKNMLGQVVAALRTEATQKQMELDQKGIYIITLQKGDAVSAKKIIIQE